MLDRWLKDEFVRFVEANPDEPLCIEVPQPADGGVAYISAQLRVPGECFVPIKDVRDERVFAQWPPRAGMPTTVSPEMESARPSSDPRKSLRLRAAWLAPFDKMQPLAVTPDDLYAQAKMRQIAEESGDDCARALVQATTEARDWVSDGWASKEQAWLQPIVAKDGEQEALAAIYLRYNIDAGSIEHAHNNGKLRKKLNVRMPVIRAWGVPGLMWALLVERLSAVQPYRTCERCGTIIRGRGHKRFCSAEDNPNCHRAWGAERKRRSRRRGATRR